MVGDDLFECEMGACKLLGKLAAGAKAVAGLGKY
jgi:hypothetical protein